MKLKSISLILFLSISTLLIGQSVEVDNGYEKGLLVDDYKVGIWEYYDNDTLKLKINYTTGKLVFLAKDTSRYAIETETGWRYEELEVPPIYIGSLEEIIGILGVNLKYPPKAKNNSIIGTVLLSFEVNLQGNADSIKIIHDIGYGCGEEVLRVFHLIPNYWLVAQKDRKQYKSRYILPVKFQIGKRTSQGEIWNEIPRSELNAMKESVAGYLPSNYLQEVVISAVQIF